MVDHVALLNEKSESLTSEDLTVKIGRRDVRATGFFDHTKATERYVILVIGDGASSREWYLPYYYRRTNVRIDTVAAIVQTMIENGRLSEAGARVCLHGRS